ncbi:MAG: CCA tRNA nucleotidyltransferase [Chloroflexi bacterium]|nr:CCA tRNA nucleotidyltransferase [Chloroflexota bacterium]
MDNLRRLISDPDLLPLPKHDLIRRIADQSAALGMPCCLVGGFVRDVLLKQPLNDFDIVMEGDAIKLGKALVKEFGGRLTTHSKFKTATWFIGDNEFLDLITARSETYTQAGALPTVKPSTVEDDLRRRDFTINAMAMRIDGDHFGELLDPLNGQKDLQAGIIRVLHPRSFVDDPTRMLRAVRYEKRYGFQIEAGTLRQFNDEARLVLSQLSGERLRHEFDLMFDEENALSMLARASELGLLQPIHSVLAWDEKIKARFLLFLENRLPVTQLHLWAVWLMSLSSAEIKSLGKRLDFTAETLKCALAASSIFQSLNAIPDMRPSQCTEWLDEMPVDAVFAVSKSIPQEKPRKMLDTYLAKWMHIKVHTAGDDLKKRGLPPGPKYKEILRRLRAAWLDGEVESVEQEERLLDILLENKGATR